ncbi:hypothetical protein BJX65DRAFT_301268 [Aspergillus insuetus]
MGNLPVPPEVLFLSLSGRGPSDYTPLLSEIPKQFRLIHIHEAPDALEVLKASQPRAVIITDEGISKQENLEVLEQVVKYVKDGGLAIVAGYWFSVDVVLGSTGDPRPFFDAFDLPWEAGNSHTYSLWIFNKNCSLPDGARITWVPDTCAMSILSLKNVGPDERIYVPYEQAGLEPPPDVTEAAVAGAHVGNGYFAYVGDLNWVMRSELLVLALLGVGNS